MAYNEDTDGTNGDDGLSDAQKEDIREAVQDEHDKDPEGTEEKYGVDPSTPYEPVPGNPADKSN